eukprot:GHVP01042491.1.p1 GENE.GHVP01042491.1~~GHVP01042491.1.p1  ORF type:complete len:1121 (-),score=214.82 GHVP01042491.1:53-3391(-)
MAEAAIGVVTAPSAEIIQLLDALISADPEVRRPGEETFQKLLNEKPDLVLTELLKVLCGSKVSEEYRHQGVVILRTSLRSFLRKLDSSIWERISPATRQALQSGLLHAVSQETSELVTRTLCPLIADMAATIIIEEAWPELDFKIFEWLRSTEPRVVRSSLQILIELVPRDADIVTKNLQTIAPVIKNCLESTNLPVAEDAITFFCSTVAHTKSKSIWEPLRAITPSVLRLLAAQAEAKNWEFSTETLKDLIQAADERPIFFSQSIETLVDTIFLIVNIEEVQDDVLQLCAELLVSLATRQKMVLKCKDFVSKSVGLFLRMLLSVSDDPDWIDREIDMEEDEKSGNYDVAESCLDRLASQMQPFENILQHVLQHSSQYLLQEGWEYKFAGIIAISQCIEYIETDEVPRMLNGILPVIMRQFEDAHHRVRFAACQAIGQIALDHYPLFQEKYAVSVLPVLMKVFDDPVVRVQMHATSAIVNLVEEAHSADILPLVPQIFEKFYNRLASDCSYGMKELIITAVAVFSGCIGKSFAPYYSLFVPAVIQIVQQPMNDKNTLLHGKCFECLSMVGLAMKDVPGNSFNSDATVIMQSILAHYNSPNKERIDLYLTEAMRRMCKSMGDSFVPVIEQIVPINIAILKEQPVNIDSELEDTKDMTLVCITDHATRALKTTTIDQMNNAMVLLKIICDNFPLHYSKYIEETFGLLIPILKFQFSEDLKSQSLATISSLLSACRASTISQSMNQLQAVSTWVKQLASQIFENVKFELSIAEGDEALEIDFEVIMGELGGLVKCLKNAGSEIFNPEGVKIVFDGVVSLIEGSSARRSEIRAEAISNAVDEADIADMEDSLKLEEGLRSTLLEVIAALMITHPKEFCQGCLPAQLQLIRRYFSNPNDNGDVAFALYILDDVIEHVGTLSGQSLGEFLPQVFALTMNPNPEIRQAAAYGCIHAFKLPGMTNEQIQSCIGNLISVVKDPNSRDKLNTLATDNAIAALGAAIVFKSDVLGDQLDQVVDIWTSCLPLKSDITEARLTHKLVSDLILNENPVVLGENNKWLNRLIGVLMQIYKTDLSSDDIDQSITIIVENTKTQIESMASTMTEEQQRGLKKVLADIQC